LKTNRDEEDNVSKLCENFFEFLDDDLDSRSAINILAKICDSVLNGSKIARNDFDRLTRVLGLVIN